jgi:hypothetical protein
MNYSKKSDEVIYSEAVEKMTSTEMVDLILALLDQCGANAGQTREAGHFFSDKLEGIEKTELWPFTKHDRSN